MDSQHPNQDCDDQDAQDEDEDQHGERDEDDVDGEDEQATKMHDQELKMQSLQRQLDESRGRPFWPWKTS